MSAPTITVAHLKALAIECLERRIQAAAIEAESCLSWANAFEGKSDAEFVDHSRHKAQAASERAFAAAAELEAIKAFQP